MYVYSWGCGEPLGGKPTNKHFFRCTLPIITHSNQLYLVRWCFFSWLQRFAMNKCQKMKTWFVFVCMWIQMIYIYTYIQSYISGLKEKNTTPKADVTTLNKPRWSRVCQVNGFRVCTRILPQIHHSLKTLPFWSYCSASPKNSPETWKKIQISNIKFLSKLL